MTANAGLQFLREVHRHLVHKRRIAVLARRIANMVPPGKRLLDVGCGDGRLAALLCEFVPRIEVQGVEVLPRPDCAIPCQPIDGIHLSFRDCSFDGCLFVDALHHTNHPLVILREARRVSRDFVLIKDHMAENKLDYRTLQLMDWVGNRPHGVALPYAYLSRGKWQELFNQLALVPARTDCDLALYPTPLDSIFGRNLHFISLLKKNDQAQIPNHERVSAVPC